MMDVAEALGSDLGNACERVEAGFYFEEGGCFGMALALHNTLCAAGIDARLAVLGGNAHAMVIVGARRLDYQGWDWRTNRASKEVGPAEFLSIAAGAGHTGDDLRNAQAYAQAAIDLVLGEHGLLASPAASALDESDDRADMGATRLRP